jgi:hypothetical protein
MDQTSGLTTDPNIESSMRVSGPAQIFPGLTSTHGISISQRWLCEGVDLGLATRPDELGCIDDKGEFMMGNKRYCYPPTVTDYSSRFS